MQDQASEPAPTASRAPSEAWFRALADNIPQLAWMAYPDGNVFWYNRRWLDYTGMTLEQHRGWGWTAAHHPDHVARVVTSVQHSWDTGEPWEDIFPLRRKDGVYRWFLSRAEPIRDAEGRITLWFGTNTDVTEQRAAEAALAESETRLRLALNAGRMGLFSWDLATDRLEWDARQFELFGMDPADGQPTGTQVMTRIHPDDLPGLHAAVTAVLEPGDRTFNYEFRLPAADGAVRWIGCYGAARRGPDGRATSMVGLSFDVTPRRAAEAALAASERQARLANERVQLALDAGAIIGTFVWQPAADHFTADDRFARSFGLDPEGFRAGMSLEAVMESIHPEDRPRVAGAVAQAMQAGGPYRCEYRVRQRDGSYRWIEANGRVDLDDQGRPVRFPGVLLDIEGRRAVELERDRATTLLRTFVETMPGVAYAKDRGGRMLVANAGVAALAGKPPEAFIGKTDAEFLDNKEQAEAIMATDRRVMQSGIGEQIEEIVNRRDGTPAVWLSTKAPLRNADGAVVGVVGTSVDITERKQAEAVLARSRAELEQLVSDRTRDLEETQARLAHAQRMEALGQLAGGIAHDFNNVLQAIHGGAGLIDRRLNDPDAVRRLSRMMREAAERGSAITRRLLAFSRKGELRAESVDPADLLGSLKEILVHTLGGGIEVRTDIAAGLPALWGDRGQLETVLVNLAANGRDAMPEGGVLILSAALDGGLPSVARGGRLPSVAREDGLPSANGPAGKTGPVPDRFIRLAVSDAGAGMTPEVLTRATEPFFTTKPDGRGTGLGLAMARGFAEQSGGALRIDSTPGRGTVVTLWLPVAQAPAVVAPEPAGADSTAMRAARILLVDDDATVLQVTAEQLEHAGYIVLSAASGAAALARLDGGAEVDLIISDLSMAGMDGIAVIQQAQQRRRVLPAILLTGFVTHAAELAVGGAISGTISLLRKPATAQQLAEQVAVLLEGAAAERGGRYR